MLLAQMSRLEISEADLEHPGRLLEVGAEETSAKPALLGPSWGDSPTDAYDLLCAGDTMGVTNMPLAVREVKAAHVAMVSA